MHEPRSSAAIVAFTVLLASSASAEADTRIGNAVRGRALAIEACSACHQVTTHQLPPAPVHNPDTLEDIAAPSFGDVARKYRGRTRSLRAFIMAPVHPMREQRFLRRDLDDIIAFIRTRRTSR